METLDNPNPYLSFPSKRQKIETLASEPPITPSSNKGKSPIISENDVETEDDSESLPENCGICMAMEGESVRGAIDSCNHYFCLLCIIQWSKIESRCPLCRTRFSTIRRVRKDGSVIGQGCVRVPIRDQIYDPFGEPVDPYAHSKCSVCNGTKDESLLLLCDLCDSASHTYCVGLGATVPEDDWYCRDCALLWSEQLDSETNDNIDENDTSNSDQIDEKPSTPPLSSVSIFDIVRDPSPERKHDLGTNRLLNLVSHPTKFSSSAIVSDRSNVESSKSGPSRGSVCSSMEVKELSARTLKTCRNIQRHINVLRENWDAVRTGSLSFSFAFSGSFGKNSEKKKEVRTTATNSCKSTNSVNSKVVDNSCDNKEPYNVDRAWKLMNIAKSKQHTEKSKSTPNITHKKVLSLRKDKFVPNFGPLRKDPNHGVNERLSHTQGIHQYTSVLESRIPKSSLPRVSQPDLKTNFHNNKECFSSSRKTGERYSNTRGDSSATSASLRGRVTEDFNSFCDKTVMPSENNRERGKSHLPDENNAFSRSKTSNEPVGCRSDEAHVKLEGKKTLTCLGKVEGKITSKGRKEDEAKAEILSLVKLNLKLVTKDKRLGVDAFKEIARLSTHTILASCGFKHRNIVGSLPTLVCRHGDETLNLHRSAIMPSSCRECFYVFVKDVVNSIMSEKLNCTSVVAS